MRFDLDEIKYTGITHELKIKAEYFIQKAYGRKNFEIRLNDRNYKVGDLVRYNVIDDSTLNKIAQTELYQITYITNFEQKENFIVFGDKLFRA